MIDKILEASLEREWMITIMYLKGEDITKRNIKVLEITKDKVMAYCYLRNENRVFKKENILSAAFCGGNHYGAYNRRGSTFR